MILPPVMKDIFHPYSDDYYSIACVYSIHEIMAEKIVPCLNEQEQGMYMISGSYRKISIWNKHLKYFLQNVHSRKYRQISKIYLIENMDFQNAWKSSLGYQLKALPDFESVFNEVTDLMNIIRKKDKLLDTKVNKIDNHGALNYEYEILRKIYNNHRYSDKFRHQRRLTGAGVATPALEN